MAHRNELQSSTAGRGVVTAIEVGATVVSTTGLQTLSEWVLHSCSTVCPGPSHNRHGRHSTVPAATSQSLTNMPFEQTNPRHGLGASVEGAALVGMAAVVSSTFTTAVRPASCSRQRVHETPGLAGLVRRSIKHQRNADHGWLADTTQGCMAATLCKGEAKRRPSQRGVSLSWLTHCCKMLSSPP